MPYLIDHFIDKAAEQFNKKRPSVPKELYTLLRNYSFPGNVRELEGIIFDALSLHKSGILSLESVRNKISVYDHSNNADNQDVMPIEEDNDLINFPGRFPTIKEAEESLINEALKRANGNQTIAADLLGLSRRALNNRLRRANDKIR